MTRTIFAALMIPFVVAPSMETLAETSPDLSTLQDFQIGLFGDISIDAGDVSLYAAGNTDLVVWEEFMIHYGLSFEQRLNSFIRIRNTLGVGYLFQRERYSVPFWVAPGITTTGLWSHYLNREFISIGAGYRYHLGERVGAGANFEGVFYGDGVSEQNLSLGLVYTHREG